uniref:Uncharacterized protein n=1 Tax=Brassica oleracea var. oleracea TaxID=109376 RepID=A0A0D3ADN4_BRAOL
MNASESVARGCALQCAMLTAILSSKSKPPKLVVCDILPFSISLAWIGASGNQESTTLFPKGTPIPSVETLTFYPSEPTSVDVQYTHLTDEFQAPLKISRYSIDPPQREVKVRLTLNGIVVVELATVEEPKTVKETNESLPEFVYGALIEEKAKKATVKELSVVEDPKTVKETNVSLPEFVYGALKEDEFKNAVVKELSMTLQDSNNEKAKHMKTAIETYVNNMQNKLRGVYAEYMIESEREAFLANLQNVKDWLSKDGQDVPREVYVKKLQELQKVGGRVEKLYNEWVGTAPLIDKLQHWVNKYRVDALSYKFRHIGEDMKKKVIIISHS